MTNAKPAVEHLEGSSEHPLCHYGSKTERPCWRAATETYFREDEAPSLCPEHKRLVEVGHEEDDLHYALDALEEWLKSKTVEAAPSGDLERHALLMRDNIIGEYARAVERTRAARMVAEDGPPAPGGPARTFEEAQELARLMIRSDAFTNAQTMLEDTPEDKFGPHDKWAIVAALRDAGRAAHEEVTRYRREVGFKD